MKGLFELLFFCLLAFSCSGNSALKTAGQKTVEVKKEFKTVEVPVMYTTPEARAEFVAMHYWDNFNFKDTSYVSLPEITEQAWSDYLQVLSIVPRNVSSEAMRRLIGQAAADSIMLAYFEKLSDKYLYDPNSPVRNEDLYISVLESLLALPIAPVEKSTFNYRLSLAKKNKVGAEATDFTYTLQNGKQGRLYSIAADYTLLFINNPGCGACAETIKALKTSPVIGNLLDNKRLAILSFYPDEDLEEWNKHLSDMSPLWINGYDKKLVIRDNDLYDLRAIPTLYLLNREKTVLLKDASFDKIEKYLKRKTHSGNN